VHVNPERGECRLTDTTLEEPEELVLRLVGVLADFQLPPIRNLPEYVVHQLLDCHDAYSFKRHQKSLKFMRQAATLSGLDTYTFNKALEGISAVRSIFLKYLRSDEQMIWVPRKFLDFAAVDVWNHLFSSSRQVSVDEFIPFDQHVDPFGVLSSVNPYQYPHTADNSVSYYRKVRKENDVLR
jgi:hypothetical protein